MATYQTGLVSEPRMLNTEIITQKATKYVVETDTKDKSIGYLDVFVHQARDIHNVCIYHKQDVYAKLCLTSDPDVSCSTKVSNGGGRNPVFDESLQLDVRTVEASLKCEIWMLSRVRNYLEDQLLGFSLVPLADIVMSDGKQAREFSLSSTDLFHTPAGFVQLSLSYIGCSPDVIVVSSPNKSVSRVEDSGNDSVAPSELEKIEFPDLNMVTENQIMVSTTSSSTTLSATRQSVSEPSETTVEASSTQSQKEKNQDATDGEVDSSEAPPKDEVVKPVISIDLQPEQSVVQQDIVDMYMKSMQQFTQSLAKMKLPLDAENTSPSNDDADSCTTEKPSPSSLKGSRVFYGSRAFF